MYVSWFLGENDCIFVILPVFLWFYPFLLLGIVRVSVISRSCWFTNLPKNMNSACFSAHLKPSYLLKIYKILYIFFCQIRHYFWKHNFSLILMFKLWIHFFLQNSLCDPSCKLGPILNLQWKFLKGQFFCMFSMIWLFLSFSLNIHFSFVDFWSGFGFAGFG